MLMSAYHLLFMIILLLTTILINPLISSVSNSSFASTVNSTYPVSITSARDTNSIYQKNNSNSTLEFEITDKLFK